MEFEGENKAQASQTSQNSTVYNDDDSADNDFNDDYAVYHDDDGDYVHLCIQYKSS